MTKRARFLAAGGGVALLLLALLFGLSDLRDLAARAAGLRWGFVVLAAAATLLSYAAIALCQRHLLAILGHPVPAWTMIRAVTVSTVANRSLRSGGASGFAMLAWLLSRRGLPASAVLSSTAGFVIQSNALFCALFLASLLLTLTGAPAAAPDRTLLALGLSALAFAASLLFSVFAVFHEGLRARWGRPLRGLAGRLGRRLGRPEWEATVGLFLERFDAAAGELYTRRRATGGAWFWAALRIASSVACLGACLAASGVPVALGVLLLAYAASKTAGVVSLVPAGLGIVEGSLVAVLVAFEVPYEAALLAALLNRAVYHLLPAALALVFFGPLLRQARETAAAD